jgi:hypothetical protein
VGSGLTSERMQTAGLTPKERDNAWSKTKTPTHT